MSEPIPGVDLVAPEAPAQPAAVAVLVRGAAGPQREVFWVRRGPRVSFSGGFHAFPGGKLEATDAEVPAAGEFPDGALRVCALRELFEETGVLLVAGAEGLEPSRLARLRSELLAGRPFPGLLEAEGLRPDLARLVPAGRWVTPDFSPIRFDARFYLAVVPEGTAASVIPGELVEGGWVRPRDALAEWEDGRVLLHPPNHHTLAVLAGFPPEKALGLLRRPPSQGPDHVVERIEFQRGILLFPLLTPTLPPARHTHAYLVGTGDLVVVDPGSPDPREQERLLDLVRSLMEEGRRPRAVLLTHHHRDHVGGAVVLGRSLGIPVLGSAATAARVSGVEGRLRDGDRIELGGPRPMSLRALLTEGHADGHLAFLEEASGALIAGDLVAGGSTVVLDPPEGDLGRYLASLRRIRALPAGTLYPAHGYVIRDGPALLEEYLAHRERRVEQVRGALGSRARRVGELVREVYTDTPPGLHPVAERSALASLLELERRGEAHREGDGWAGGAAGARAEAPEPGGRQPQVSPPEGKPYT